MNNKKTESVTAKKHFSQFRSFAKSEFERHYAKDFFVKKSSALPKNFKKGTYIIGFAEKAFISWQ